MTTRRAAPRSGSPPRAGSACCSPPRSGIADDPVRRSRSARRGSPSCSRSGRPRALAAVPGLRTWIVYMQVRTRVIDDALRAFVAGGGRQLVLLGAGYDCPRAPDARARRGARCSRSITRRPRATSAPRSPRSASPRRRAYVTWDFEAARSTSCPTALAAAGHEPAHPTLTIWEGVTMYLTAARDRRLAARDRGVERARLAARDDLLRARAARASRRSRPGSSRPRSPGSASRGPGAGSPTSSPVTSPTRGWQLVDDVATPDAARRLLPAALARTIDRADRRIALAIASESIALAAR